MTMSKRFKLFLGAAAVILLVVAVFGLVPDGKLWLTQMSNGGKFLWPVVIVAALLDSINPCAFSILFLTITFLFSLGKSRKEVFKIGIIYIIGIYLVYLLIGLGVLQTLQIFNIPRFVSKFAAIFLIVWGSINLLGELIPGFPIKLKMPEAIHGRLALLIHKASIPAAFIMGLLVGATEFPCTGGPYLMILSLLHDHTKFWAGLGYLLVYNLIFVSPLVVILGLASDPGLHDKVKLWKKANSSQMEIVSSLVFIVMGIIVLLV